MTCFLELAAVALAMATGTARWTPADAPPARPLNIVITLADDLRYGDLRPELDLVDGSDP